MYGAHRGEASRAQHSGRAIEVAATMGDSVMGVTHLGHPRGGKVTPVTCGLFVVGALMLVMAAVAFGVGVRNAEANKASKAAWIESNRPAHQWRPTLMSAGYDWMAVGGAAAGLVLVVLGLLRVREERTSPYFRIGDDPGVEFATGESPAGAFPLVAPIGDQFFVHFTGDMDGEARLAGQTRSLAELAAQGVARASARVPGAFALAIAPDARIRVQTGRNAFSISSVPVPRRQITPLFGAIERRALAFLAGSVIAHLGFVGLLRTIPPDAHTMQLDLAGSEARMSRIYSKAKEEPVQKPEESGEEAGQAAGEDSATMAAASSDAPPAPAPSGPGLSPASDAPASSEEARAVARRSGVLGVIGDREVFAALTETTHGFPGMMTDDFHLALNGEPGGGSGGFGDAPTGWAGGCVGCSGVRAGAYATIGLPGAGGGQYTGPGVGRGMRRHRTIRPELHIGKPSSTTGGLDKHIIRRSVRRHIDRIKYCYEKQLMADAELAGTVTSSFQISPQGTVLSATAQGVSGQVSSCVAATIKTIQFPRPKHGTLVQVSYPFTFRPTGR